MNEFTNAVMAAVGFAVVVGGSGAAFAFGVASVWKKMKWAPVNITVNVFNHGDGEMALTIPPAHRGGEAS